MSTVEPVVTGGGRGRFGPAVLTVVVASAALYFARIVFEPVAFALFGMALVWPFQKAAEARMPKSIALVLTVLLTLIVISVLAWAIIWSIGDVVHWVMANVVRFLSLYMRVTQWLEGHDIFVAEAFGQLDVRNFVGIFQGIAIGVNYFIGFCLVIFLFLMFGLTEVSDFRIRFDELETKIGWNISQTAGEIAKKIRKYMLIRTLASVVTGLAVFIFTLSIGLDLAVAWGVISFVLNYIPYIGPLVAVVLPVLFATVQFESWQMVVFIFGALYVIQFLIGNYLEPMIAGKALAISPFLMLFAFFFWDFLWGMPGAFIGLPVTIALFTICEQNPSSRWIATLLSTSGSPSATSTD
jgi:predicted PurR-regulated permease PerM